MARVLSSGQAEELHKSIIAYLLANNRNNTTKTLRSGLGLGEDVFDAELAKKYEVLLEKKWATVDRLEKKILLLETRNHALQEELIGTTSQAKQHDPVAWLPQSTPRYSLESHQGTVNCVAFHPRFSSCASGSDDCTIKIWDWEFGELEKTIRAHTQAVRDIDYAGFDDNNLLASCSSDLTIKLWDPADDYANIRTLQGHEHSITAVRFAPNYTGWYPRRNLLVSASGDQTLKIWNVSDGSCVRTLQGHSNWVRGLSLAVDGQYLLSASMDKTAMLWDISVNVPKTMATLHGHENGINCCAIAPPTANHFLASLAGQKTSPPETSTAQFLATGSRDKTIKLWDNHGTCFATLVGHDNWVSALVFHPGGRYLLSVADDKTLRCWDLSLQGKCTHKLDGIHDQFITCLRWANNNAAKQTRPVNGYAVVPNTDGSKKLQIRCVVATGSIDKSIKIFSR